MIIIIIIIMEFFVIFKTGPILSRWIPTLEKPELRETACEPLAALQQHSSYQGTNSHKRA
jgi:hypothetical protein